MLEETAEKSWWELEHQGAEAVAQYLQTVATEWDVRLPENWLEKAKEFAENPPEPEPETENDEENDDEENNEEEEQ
jgi:hypothetical protein